MLYLVPTPIGNLADLTFRAKEVLDTVEYILAEDTRVSGKLLKHYGIQTPMRAFHQHNEHKVLESIIQELKSGKNIAVISDAGTPGISDPGFLLVRACVQEGIEVQCLPGATAFVPAIVNSGLPSDRFCFEGFLPQKKGRQTRLKELADEKRTIVLYESPHRLVKLLDEIATHMGTERQVSVSREISKMYEETRRGSADELKKHFETNPPKGEIALVVQGKKD